MPTNLFYTLREEKKTKIINAAISEFAKYGYINSSTNQIVKNCAISKGSLFQYFQNKEDLFFHILDSVTAELTSYIEENFKFCSKNLFERVLKYSELEFTWYMQNPDKCRLIVAAFTKSDTAIFQKTEHRYHMTEHDIFHKLLEDIEENELKWDKQKTILVLKWFLKGFNEAFLDKINIDSNSEIDEIKNKYMKSISEYLQLLKEGLI